MSSDTQVPSASAPRWRDGAGRYGRISRVNHWVLAALAVAMIASGLALEYAPMLATQSAAMRDWHKAVGVIVLGLGLWRVGWRLVQGFPGGAGTGPAWQEKVAQAAHWALLGAIVVMPASGLLMTVFHGRSVEVLGLAIPAGPEVAWLAELAGGIHAAGGLALAALVVLHVGAALKHHLIDRDDTLRRMLPGPRSA